MFKKIIPAFWFHTKESDIYQSLFNYRRMWFLTAGLTLALTLVPLIIFGVIDYNATRRALGACRNTHRLILALNTVIC